MCYWQGATRNSTQLGTVVLTIPALQPCGMLLCLASLPPAVDLLTLRRTITTLLSPSPFAPSASTASPELQCEPSLLSFYSPGVSTSSALSTLEPAERIASRAFASPVRIASRAFAFACGRTSAISRTEVFVWAPQAPLAQDSHLLFQVLPFSQSPPRVWTLPPGCFPLRPLPLTPHRLPYPYSDSECSMDARRELSLMSFFQANPAVRCSACWHSILHTMKVRFQSIMQQSLSERRFNYMYNVQQLHTY